jgi:hypothetical protein
LRPDRGANLLCPLCLHATGFHLLGQELVGLSQPQLQRWLRNVLHQHGRAAHGTCVGNAAAHDARTQYGGLLNRPCLPHVTLGLFLEELVIGEEAHQRDGGFGLAQPCKDAGLFPQRCLRVLARGVSEEPHERLGGWVVAC